MPTTFHRFSFGLVAFALFISSSGAAQELFPGAVWDPAGRQANMVIEYNSAQDNYMMGYSNGRALVAPLQVDGSFTSTLQIPVSANTGVASMALRYNSVDNEFLYIWRNGSPTTIRGRFLDTNGNPIGTEFAVGDGKQPHLAFSPANRRFVVTFAKPGGVVRYKVIDGDSTNPSPILKTGDVSTADALKENVAYGSVSDKFLVTYVRDFPGGSDIFGRFIAGDGMSLEPEFAINRGANNQTGPLVDYSRKEDRWIVAYLTWVTNPPNVNVAVVSPARTVTRNFAAASTSAWEVPGAVVYNDETETVTFAWRHAGAVVDARAREWQVSDAGAAPVGPLITLSSNDPGVQFGAARPDPVDPQVTILWRKSLGGDGIHAGIIHVTPPPPDLTPPEDIDDLAGTTGGPPLIVGPVTAISASDETGTHPRGDSVDGDLATYWGTSKDDVLQEETITWDLGGVRDLSNVVLWSRSAGDQFPLNYELEASIDGSIYNTVFTMVGAVVPPGTSIQHDFAAPVSAQFMRLNVTTPRQTATGKYQVQVAEAVFQEADPTPGLITVTFTAPGDDLDVGAADFYTMKWSESPINDGNFDAANNVAGLPPPQLAGNTETIGISGLPDETQVYVAVKATDDSANTNNISNLPPPINTPGVPPAAVNDLAVVLDSPDVAHLTWTATGDDGLLGDPADYDIRYSTAPISAANFDLATQVPFTRAPVSGGSPEPAFAVNVPAESDVYFRIKVLDEVGNASPIDTTTPAPMVTTVDFDPPGPIVDLEEVVGAASPTRVPALATDTSGDLSGAKGVDEATDSDPSTFWSSPARNGVQEYVTVDAEAPVNFSQVRLLSRNAGSLFPEEVTIQVSDEEDTGFVTVDTFPGLPATKGLWHTLDFTPTTGQFLKVLVTGSRTTSGGVPQAQIAEIEVYESPVSFGEVRLGWTAPGDNGTLGQAQSYELKWRDDGPITAGNFGSSTSFAIPPPQPGGTAETATVTGLPNEKTIYFAMTATDEVPLTSFISNVAMATTPGIAPNAVSDLAASGPTGNSIVVSWTATGDDANSGTADEYDLRISTSPIDETNFGSATRVTIPSPQVATTPEVVTIGGGGFGDPLDDDTTYFVALKVIDEVGNVSPIQSNGAVTETTLDTTDPGAVSNLTASPGAATLTLLDDAEARETSGDLSGAKGILQAMDNDTSTFWSSPATGGSPTFFVTADTLSAHTVSRITLTARSGGALFPEDVTIQVSNNNIDFFDVQSFTGLPVTAGMVHTLDFPAVAGQYFKVLITKPRLTSTGLNQSQIAEIEVFEAAPAGQFQLTWASPGDDPGIGTPTEYDVRFDTDPILNNSDFNNADPLDGEPTPEAFGETETFNVTAPEEGTVLYFALKAIDEAGNIGPLSNSAAFTTTITPAAPVLDLQATHVTSLTAEVQWMAPGDDGLTGTATLYDMRISTSPIDDGNFGAATPVTALPPPSTAGTLETFTIGLSPSTPALTPSTTYYVALKTEDETSTPSGLSNVITFTTDVTDTVDPGAIDDLRGGPPTTLTVLDIDALESSGDGKPLGNVTDENPSSHWASVGRAVHVDEWITFDLGSPQLIGQVRMLSRSAGSLFPEDVQVQVSDDNALFTTIAEFTGLPATAGNWNTLDFTPASGRYVRINMTKLRTTGGGLHVAHIAEIELSTATFSPGPITLAWMATGDDGEVGRATSYDLRWSESPIDDGNFNLANPLAAGSPQDAGTLESITIPGLTTGVTLYFAIKAIDEAGQQGPISNVHSVFNP